MSRHVLMMAWCLEAATVEGDVMLRMRRKFFFRNFHPPNADKADSTQRTGRQISPGHFSGNAVKSPEKPGFFPDFMMFSGAACGRAHTHAIFFSAASILLHQPVTTLQATTATPLANYSILLRSSIQFVHLETFKCCTLMCISGNSR